MVLRSDNEAAILSIVKAAQEARKPHKTVLETIPKHSHASLGHAEQCNRMLKEGARCILANLAEKTGKVVGTAEVLFAWIVRHAAWIRHRYAVHATGRTSYR